MDTESESGGESPSTDSSALIETAPRIYVTVRQVPKERAQIEWDAWGLGFREASVILLACAAARSES